MNTHIQRTLAALAITGTLGLGAAVGMAVGHADELDTIRLTDIPNIDALPQCSVEDCSDLRPDEFPAVWHNDGDWYLAPAHDAPRWLLIVDNTVTHAHGVAAADGGVPGPQ
jgi:hypothetical protein